MGFSTQLVITTTVLLAFTACESAPKAEQWVSWHNKHRRAESASNMQQMVWNADLANLAKRWANRCQWGHRPQAQRQNVAGFNHVGENLYASTKSDSVESVLKAWVDEKVDYNYYSNSCRPNKVCGHYTQVVWANSCAVGCAVAYCPKFKIFNHDAYYTVCNYGEGGNFYGQKPYKRGSGGLIASKCGKKISNKLPPRTTSRPVTRRKSTRSPRTTKPLIKRSAYEEYLDCYMHCKRDGVTMENYHSVIKCMRKCYSKLKY